jgi:predicted ATPase/DNA-binding winged helix-turn-helix (wHTH) protein
MKTLRLRGGVADLTRREFLRGIEVVRLTSTESRLLTFLAGHAGRPIERDELLREVWGYRGGVRSRTVDTTIQRLRSKIERDPAEPEHIVSVHGVGYRFELPEPAEEPVVAGTTELLSESDAFFGRVEALVAVDEALAAGSRLVTLLGPPGVGKSRLARHFATQALPRYPGGIWWCDLGGVAPNPAGLGDAVGTAIGAPPRHGLAADPVAGVQAALGGRVATMVVLDGFDHLAPCAQVVGRWRSAAPGCTFMATSRVPLQLAGERRVEVQPFAQITASVDDPAVALFLDRARAVRPDFAPQDEDLEELAALIGALDGLPLAIELAAARMDVITMGQLRGLLDRRFELLRRPGRQGLRAALDSSWSLLAPWEDAAAAQLSVFEGGFDLEMAEAVLDLSAHPGAPWALDVVTSLRERSLLMRSQGEDSLLYAFLGSVRAYARAHSGPCAQTRRRHRAWCARAGAAAGLPDLRAATLSGLEDDDLAGAAAAAAPALSLCARRGRLDEGRALGHAVLEVGPAPGVALLLARLDMLAGDLEAAVAGTGALVEAQAPTVRAGARALLARCCADLGRLDEALAAAQSAQSTHTDEGATLSAEGLLSLSVVLTRLGRRDEGEGLVRRALQLCETQEDHALRATCLRFLAMRRKAAADSDGALLFINQALDAARMAGVRFEEVLCLMWRGVILSAAGSLAQAGADLQRTASLARAIGFREGAADAAFYLAYVYWAEPDAGAAEAAFTEAEAIHQGSGRAFKVAWCRGNIGRVRMEAGDFAGACEALGNYAAGLEPEDLLGMNPLFQLALAEARAALGEAAGARAALAASHASRERFATPLLRAYWAALEACVLHRLADPDAAKRLAAARRGAASLADPSLELARTLARAGDLLSL